MNNKIKATTLSCTISETLLNKLNLAADLEERSKSFFVKKSLEGFLDERIKKEIVEQFGEEKYHQYLEINNNISSLLLLRKALIID